MNSKRAVAQLLKHLSAIGVTHLPKVDLRRVASPTDRKTVTVRSAGAVAGTIRQSGSPEGRPANRSPSRQAADLPVTPVASANSGQEKSPPPRTFDSMFRTQSEIQTESAARPTPHSETQTLMKQNYSTVAQKEAALCSLSALVSRCTRCSELASTRTQTVFGVGRPDARIMFIGEAPGADEDACGEPFVGRAGQLMNKIIDASGLKREELYICNILRCRPPGNRNPLPQEAANCREYLDAQIRIVRPEYIICWGTVAAQNLLSEKRTIGKLRGQFLDYQGIQVLCTYHPSYLLRYPTAKTQVWEDMKFFMKALGVELK